MLHLGHDEQWKKFCWNSSSCTLHTISLPQAHSTWIISTRNFACVDQSVAKISRKHPLRQWFVCDFSLSATFRWVTQQYFLEFHSTLHIPEQMRTCTHNSIGRAAEVNSRQLTKLQGSSWKLRFYGFYTIFFLFNLLSHSRFVRREKYKQWKFSWNSDEDGILSKITFDLISSFCSAHQLFFFISFWLNHKEAKGAGT